MALRLQNFTLNVRIVKYVPQLIDMYCSVLEIRFLENGQSSAVVTGFLYLPNVCIWIDRPEQTA